MVEEALNEAIIRYEGLFDWDGLYLAIADWFKRYRFFFHEETYKHKVPSPFGAEQELTWFGEVEVNEYIKLRIRVDFHIWDMTEVEVIKDNKKKLLTNARLEIKLKPYMNVDYQNIFAKSKLTRALGNFYNKYAIRRLIESGYGDMLAYRTWNLHAYIKKYLDMQTAWHEYAGYLGESR